MIVLDTSHTLKIVLEETASTQLDFYVSYIDTANDEVGSNEGTTNDTTDVTLVNSPSSGKRLIRFINIYNADDTSHNVVIKIDDGTNQRVLKRVTLTSKDSLVYTPSKGWVIESLRKFIQLDDTPNSYSGLAGKLFKVNSAETALEASTNTDSEIAEAVNVAANVIEKVAEVEVSSDCTYVDFTGLDGNSAWFYILLATTRNPTSSEAWCDIFVNGDTDNTHYYAQKLHVCGTNDDKERHNDARLIHAYANNRGFSKAVIFKDPDGYFKWRAELILSTGSGVRLYSIAGSKTATIDNITSLRIQARISNAIGAGSKFILFKARRG